MHDGDDTTPADEAAGYADPWAPPWRSPSEPEPDPAVSAAAYRAGLERLHAAMAPDRTRIMAFGSDEPVLELDGPVQAYGVIERPGPHTPACCPCATDPTAACTPPPDLSPWPPMPPVVDEQLDAMRATLAPAVDAFRTAGAGLARVFAAGGRVTGVRPATLADLEHAAGGRPVIVLPPNLAAAVMAQARQVLDAFRPVVRMLQAAGIIPDPAGDARRRRLADMHRRYAHRRGRPGRTWRRKSGRRR